MKLNYLLGVCVLSLSLASCNEQPKTDTPVVVETPAETTVVVKQVVVEQPKAETKPVVEKEKVVVEEEKRTQISIGSDGASLKTKKVDIKINE
ncbi:MAG TPA: hypothetical protein VF677_03585 [Flavobacterium sp.]|jgi:hypothetical protein